VRSRKILLPALLSMALVLSLVVPALAAGASGAVPPPHDRPTSYSAVDSSSLFSAMTLNAPEGEVTPMVAAGQDHTVGLKSVGIVVATGVNHDGQCNVDGWTDIMQVAAGYWHTVGLKKDGTVVAAGDNDHEKCEVGNWTDIVQVDAGWDHTVGLQSDGTVVAVGDNDYGECEVGNWTDIVQIAAGGHHTVGLRSDGTVIAVGSNYLGECAVEGWTDITQVAAGYDYTVGVKSDGTVVAVGENDDGECEVGNWTDIVQISAGYEHTVGLKTDGTVVAVGSNGSGRRDVGSWTDIVQVAAGWYHTVGLQSDGTAVAVGASYQGQCDIDEWNLVLVVLTISSNAGGTVTTPGEGSFDYDIGTVVSLVAQPKEGYQFGNWTGDVSTVGDISAASTSISMRSDYSITANFEETHVVEWVLIGVIIVLVIAALVIFFVRKRRLAKRDFESKIWGFLRRPIATFGQVKEEKLSVALKYALIGLLIFGVLAGIMLALLWSNGLFELFELLELDIGWFPDNPLLLIAAVIGLSVAGGMLVIFIGGALMHLWVYIFGGRRGHGYRQTLKAIIYGATPLYMVGWVPFVGVLIGSIWAIVLIIIGLRELHGITTGRAAGAALLAIGIAVVVVVLLVVVLLAAFLGPFVYLFIWWLALFLFMGG
jgi:hypothetical protein